MKVLVIAKGDFVTSSYTGVTSIAYTANTNTYTITHSGGTTVTFSAANYYISILWA